MPICRVPCFPCIFFKLYKFAYSKGFDKFAYREGFDKFAYMEWFDKFT